MHVCDFIAPYYYTGSNCNNYVPGQQRSKQLSTLYKDERCQQLPAFNILEKMYVKYYNVEFVCGPLYN